MWREDAGTMSEADVDLTKQASREAYDDSGVSRTSKDQRKQV